ncbi:formyltransferase family protein, partial [Escherichia coli]
PAASFPVMQQAYAAPMMQQPAQSNATAHYVNDNLDEGPIIMQDVIHVDHTYTAEDMMRAGRDVEKNVLSRALYKVLAQRVFVYGNRTIIL